MTLTISLGGVSARSFAAATTSTALDQFLQLDLADLAEVEVTTPTRTARKLTQAPGAITVISRDQILRSPARTLPDLLRLVPGVNVRWNPMVQTIDIRGFGANPFTSRVLLLIDGVPFNSWNKGGFPQHPGLDFFNIDAVEQIEVVRGSGSALYGENAFNGMINIVTASSGPGANTSVSTQVGSDNLRIFSLNHSRPLGDRSSISLAARQTQGQMASELWQDNDLDGTGYDLYLKAELRDLQLTYYRRQDSFDGFRVTPGNPNFPEATVFRSADRIRQSINIVSANYEHESSDERWQFKGFASFANRSGGRCAACHAPGQNQEFTKSADHGYQGLVRGEMGLTLPRRHQLLAGVEWRQLATGDQIDATNELVGPEAVAARVERYAKGALFVQDEYRSADERTQFTLGLRYDARTRPNLFSDNWFPRIALVHQATPKVTLRAGWSKAARYPTFTELYQASWFLAAEAPGFTLPLGNFEPNDELRPERITSIELGAQWRVTENLTLRLDGYENVVDNPIQTAYPRFRSENHPGQARVRGLETVVQSTPWPWLAADISWSYQNVERRSQALDSGGNRVDLSYAPQHKLATSLRFTVSPYLSSTLQANWQDAYRAPAFWYPIVFGNPTPTDLPGYTYVDLRLDYRPGLGRRGRPLTLSLIGGNLLNERPRETLTGFGGRAEGRAVRVELTYRRQD